MKLAFDMKLLRPACVLVAAGMGADTECAKRFHSETWLTTITDGMRVYEITPEQLDEVVNIVNEHAPVLSGR